MIYSGLISAFVALFVLALPSNVVAHDISAEIKKIQQATSKYSDVNVALAEGYVPAPPGHCIDAASEGLPPEWGGMGIHYIRPDVLKITATDPRVDGMSTHTDFMKPAILLYEPQANGGLILVGAENLVFMKAWKEAGHHNPPKSMGRTWDTMMDDANTPQDEAHMFQPHHDQHVYFRKHANLKDGLNPFSPTVSCKYGKKG
ncbi:MAG: hypothetical protein O3A85_00220 [Proteobacteria bacterium]|nr:hypothetical protein [Pseudomonadota bacterium]